jgi:L-seryl-tRNA(Ser) seleniumtransferase
MRALRCDKTVFALLSYTLSRYLVDQPLTAIETYNLLTADPVLLKHRANAIIEALDPKIVKILNLTARESLTEAGSGSMPTAQIPSAALVAIPQNISETHLARLFRSYNPPIIGYCKNGEFWLDLKAVASHELPIIQTAIRDIGLSLLSKS